MGFFAFLLVVAVEDRFDHFKVPVAELMPGELIEHTGSLIEIIRIQRFADLTDNFLQPGRGIVFELRFFFCCSNCATTSER